MYGARYFGARYFGGRYFGKTGLVVLGAYNGAHYFGRRYFGRRYWALEADSDPFSLTVTNTLAAVGESSLSAPGGLAFTAVFNVAQVGALAAVATGSIGAALEFSDNTFIFTPPLDLPLASATVVLSGDIVISSPAPGVGRYFGPRYFGAKYFGLRYWGTSQNFNLAQTSALAATGTANLSGGFDTLVNFAQTNVLIASASASIAGSLQVTEPEIFVGHGAWDGPRPNLYPLFVGASVTDDDDTLSAVVSAGEARDALVSAVLRDEDDILIAAATTRMNLIRGKIRRRLAAR